MKLFYPLFSNLDMLDPELEKLEKSKEASTVVSKQELWTERSNLLHNLLCTISGILKSQIELQVRI